MSSHLKPASVKRKRHKTPPDDLKEAKEIKKKGSLRRDAGRLQPINSSISRKRKSHAANGLQWFTSRRSV